MYNSFAYDKRSDDKKANWRNFLRFYSYQTPQVMAIRTQPRAERVKEKRLRCKRGKTTLCTTKIEPRRERERIEIQMSDFANNKLKTETFPIREATRNIETACEERLGKFSRMWIVFFAASAAGKARSLLLHSFRLIWISLPSFLSFHFDVNLINESESKEQFSVFCFHSFSFVGFVDSQEKGSKGFLLFLLPWRSFWHFHTLSKGSKESSSCEASNRCHELWVAFEESLRFRAES